MAPKDTRPLTIVVKMTAREMRERFGDDLKKWTAGAKIKAVGPNRYVGIQSPHFTGLEETGLWELASVLRLPVFSISREEPWQ